MNELRLPAFGMEEFGLDSLGCLEGADEGRAAVSDGAQASLLAEDSRFSIDLSTCMDVSSEPFPCLADELEQQAKALEREWYCPIQALGGTGTPSPRGPRTLPALLPSPAPALRHSSLDLHQQQLAAAAAAGPALMEGCGEEVGPSAFPTTPTRHSAGYGSSSWSESHQCTLPADPQEVQSPARPRLLVEPAAGPLRVAPISLAVDNAESIRFGRQPICPAAWRGCSKNPWCNRELRHAGPCNHRAAVPGLLAYSQRRLFEAGVNVEELCRAPELVACSGSRALSTEQQPASATGLLLTKRRAECDVREASPDPAGPSMQQAELAAASPGSSSGSPTAAAAEQQRAASSDALSGHSQQGSRAERSSSSDSQQQRAAAAAAAQEQQHAKRRRVGSGAFGAAEEEGDEEGPGVVVTVIPAPSSSAQHLAAATAQLLACEATQQGAPAAEAALGAEQAAAAVPRAGAGAPRASLRHLAAGRSSSRARAGAAVEVPQQAQQQQGRLPAPASRLRGTSTPSKGPARQLLRTPPASNPGVRPGQRRGVVHWNTESVTDPRSGQVVYAVDPATFCTQCFVTHTPVWRAGPFGSKTLCNACGVRYMKHAKSRK